MGHSADVAAVLRTLLEAPTIGARLARLLGRDALESDQIERLTALVALHDLGKINNGFQRKPFLGPGPRAGHVAPLVSLLDTSKAVSDVAARRFAEALVDRGGLGQLTAVQVEGAFEAIMAHHGRLPSPQTVDPSLWAPAEAYDPIDACGELVEAIRDWCPAAFEGEPLPWTHPFGHAFAGLVTLADWLGSDADHFGFPEDGAPDGPDRFAWALDRARGRVRAIGLDPSPLRAAARDIAWTFEALTTHRDPSVVQARMLDLPAPASAGRITILEAETGSGKTEAALIHFLDLFRQGAVDGMYFALPTRVAAKQMHERIKQRVEELLPGAGIRVGLAVPGYLAQSHDAPLPESHALWPDEAQDHLRDATWAAERSKRYLAGWVMVGTVDQVLLGGLQGRHAQLRSATLLRLLLVVDEVHASDVYMTAVLRNLLLQHRNAGGHALLMSATLGAACRLQLLNPRGRTPEPPLETAVSAPYPAIWVDSSTEPLELPPAGRASRPKKVHVRLEPDWQDVETVVCEAIDAARSGARVLVIRNSVRLAVASQQVLELHAPELGLAVATGTSLVVVSERVAHPG